MLAETLRNINLTPIIAHSGQDGLEKLHQHSDIRLVISDCFMPDMDGLTMIELMKCETNADHVNFLMLSGEYDHELVKRGKVLGVRAWIIKPFNVRSLQQTIVRLLAET